MSTPATRGHLTVGVDVGGTFTDVFVLDPAGGEARILKVPSTRGDESVGFLAGVSGAVDAPASIATIVHGTTVGTNALLERKLARCGVITTRGFRDVLEMRRRDRPTTWGLWGRFEPVVAREHRLEVDERVLADGSVLQAVDTAAVRDAAHALLAAGCEAACIFFINSYANPANEIAALAVLRELWPNSHVTASHEILPEVREYERASTASLNAALQPVVGRYVERIERTLREQQVSAPLLIVQSNGGVMTVDAARRYPVRTALSGPAAGVIACAHLAAAAGFPNVITGDVGGTSFDVSLIVDGKVAQAAQKAVDFGLVIRTPMVEITTIGAGGGSIASVDASGLLQVGPESAGSTPGPVCYGQRPASDTMGPTVTDANLVLGRINAARPIGGGLERLDTDAARAAIAGAIAAPLGLDAEAAAEAVLTVANAHMAGAVRLVSIERGHDPKDFAYMPFGGGGALHVCAMMREVGVATGLVPRYPGVSSALGCAIADMRHDFVQTLNVPLDRLDMETLQARVAACERDSRAALEAAGIALQAVELSVELDMLYVGQTHTVAVPLPAGHLGGADASRQPGGPGLEVATVAEAFDRAYAATFGKPLSGVARRVMNLRVAVIGRRPRFDLDTLAPARSGDAPPPVATRPVRHEGRWHDTPVHDRLALPAGARFRGPVLFEQPDTTIWLEPGFDAHVDRLGNIVIHAPPSA
ncbi:MAG: hydantoinase/oxoprolinase family protein [Burkholderiaceae bacterium]